MLVLAAQHQRPTTSRIPHHLVSRTRGAAEFAPVDGVIRPCRASSPRQFHCRKECQPPGERTGNAGAASHINPRARCEGLILRPRRYPRRGAFTGGQSRRKTLRYLASIPSSRAFIAGHSSSMQLNHIVSRVVPFVVEHPLAEQALFHQPEPAHGVLRFHVRAAGLELDAHAAPLSNAWRSIRYLASVLSAVRWNSSPSHVQPISTRLCSRTMLPNRVEPGDPSARALHGDERQRHAALPLVERLLEVAAAGRLPSRTSALVKRHSSGASPMASRPSQ